MVVVRQVEVVVVEVEAQQRRLEGQVDSEVEEVLEEAEAAQVVGLEDVMLLHSESKIVGSWEAVVAEEEGDQTCFKPFSSARRFACYQPIRITSPFNYCTRLI